MKLREFLRAVRPHSYHSYGFSSDLAPPRPSTISPTPATTSTLPPPPLPPPPPPPPPLPLPPPSPLPKATDEIHATITSRLLSLEQRILTATTSEQYTSLKVDFVLRKIPQARKEIMLFGSKDHQSFLDAQMRIDRLQEKFAESSNGPADAIRCYEGELRMWTDNRTRLAESVRNYNKALAEVAAIAKRVEGLTWGMVEQRRKRETEVMRLRGESSVFGSRVSGEHRVSPGSEGGNEEGEDGFNESDWLHVVTREQDTRNNKGRKRDKCNIQ